MFRALHQLTGYQILFLNLYETVESRLDFFEYSPKLFRQGWHSYFYLCRIQWFLD